MSVSVDGSNGITFNDGSSQTAAASPYVLKNRIINGDMRIDQRNAGASTTWNSGTDGYAIDRWGIYNSTSVGVFTVQQSSIAPSGFSNSQLITITTADSSLGTTEWAGIEQVIEGTNIYDLGWGTSNAATVTLSFWVRSSLTGTFGGSLQNNARNRAYPFTYTISASNTWEQKSITITGDTTGTWLTTTGRGIRLTIGLGVGSTYSGTANSWSSNNYYSATGATSVVGTNGATFYFTGVQLERNTSATPFERRMYGQELALCQRYYYRNKAIATGNRFGSLFCETTTLAQCIIPFPVSMRTNPTALEQSGTAGDYTVFAGGAVTTCNSVPVIGNATTEACNTVFSVASGFTIGHGGAARAANTNAYLGFSAEL